MKSIVREYLLTQGPHLLRGFDSWCVRLSSIRKCAFRELSPQKIAEKPTPQFPDGGIFKRLYEIKRNEEIRNSKVLNIIYL